MIETSEQVTDPGVLAALAVIAASTIEVTSSVPMVSVLKAQYVAGSAIVTG
jgi:hypothetical protein